MWSYTFDSMGFQLSRSTLDWQGLSGRQGDHHKQWEFLAMERHSSHSSCSEAALSDSPIPPRPSCLSTTPFNQLSLPSCLCVVVVFFFSDKVFHSDTERKAADE
ncbi:unnamed protein product [Boreogadus saida]